MQARLKLAVKSLGCKVNQYEIDNTITQFETRGVKVLRVENNADVVIINTCSVTNVSEKKSRQLIRRSAQENPKAYVAVTGCSAEQIEKINLKGVNRIIRNSDKDKIALLIDRDLDLPKSKDGFNTATEKARPLLKIADGCNEFCSYCTIPLFRGPLKSRDTEEIINEADRLTSLGANEIVLTGIHIGKYGRDNGKTRLSALVGEMKSNIKYLPRIRLSSIEVNEIDERLIEMISGGTICRHLHVPLQSGSAKILKLMKRSYDPEFYIDTINKIREKVPLICVSTDVIAGFPQESSGDVEKTKKTLVDSGVSKVHVFKFSARPGTEAYHLEGQIDSREKAARVRELNLLGNNLQKKFLEKNIGQELGIIVDNKVIIGGKRYLTGLSDNYVRAYIEVAGPLKNVREGRIIMVEPVSLINDGLVCKAA